MHVVAAGSYFNIAVIASSRPERMGRNSGILSITRSFAISTPLPNPSLTPLITITHSDRYTIFTAVHWPLDSHHSHSTPTGGTPAPSHTGCFSAASYCWRVTMVSPLDGATR